MQTNLLWTGREYHSLENCVVSAGKSNEINSTIVGYYQNKIYAARYNIKIDNRWRTQFLALHYNINNKQNKLTLKSNAEDWLLNNKKTCRFKDCIYVDISITPFTNTLPVNNLQLAINEERKIKVVYIDIFEQQITPVEQIYRRLSNTKYLYRNVPNDFEAEIEFDESGFVIDYPYLFRRTALIKIL